METTSDAKFQPIEIAYRIPGKAPKRKVCRTEKQLDAFLAKLEEQGGETLAFSTDGVV